MCNDGVSILFVLHMTKESQTCECVNMKYVQQISPFCFARKSPSEPPAFSQKNSVNTRVSWRSHSLRRMKCLNILICIYVIICLDIYIRDVYIMSFYVLRLCLWRICVHDLLIYVHLERSGANPFMFRILI